MYDIVMKISNIIIAIITGAIVALFSSHITCRKNLKDQLNELKEEIDYNIGLCTTNEDIVNGMKETQSTISLRQFYNIAWDKWRKHYLKIPSTDATYNYIEIINEQMKARPVYDDIGTLNSISYNINELRKKLDEAKNEAKQIKLKLIRCGYDFKKE